MLEGWKRFEGNNAHGN